MRLQASSGGLTIGETDNRYLRLTGGTVAGNLTVNQGRLTLEAPAGTIPAGPDDPSPGQSVEHTWSNSGKTWTALKVNAVNTASGSASKLLDLQVGGSSKFAVDKNGALVTPGLKLSEGQDSYSNPTFLVTKQDGSAGAGLFSGQYFSIGGGTSLSSSLLCIFNGNSGNGFVLSKLYGFCWSPNSSGSFQQMNGADTGMFRNAAGVVEFNNGTAGTLRDWKARRGTFTEYAALEPTSEPSAPASGVVLFCVTSGGKAVLKVKSPSADVGTLYPEP